MSGTEKGNWRLRVAYRHVSNRPEADIPVWVKRLSLLITVAQRIHQQSKRRRGQTSTRVVQVVTRIRRAPIFEYAFELAFCEIWQHQVLWHVGQSQSPQGRFEHRGRTVKNKLAFDANPQFAAAFFKFPGIQPAVSGQSQIDAVVAC